MVFFCFPNIPRKLKKCDACIFVKYSKQIFHDSTSRAYSILGIVYSNFYVLYLNGKWYPPMVFTHDIHPCYLPMVLNDVT